MVVGLEVTPGAAADELVLSPGHGLTPAGELTLLPNALSVRLADIPLAEQLSARFSLSRLPQPALRNRTGLFVLALRPVEFTANPIGAYPTRSRAAHGRGRRHHRGHRGHAGPLDRR